jgi:hypothetical protein
MKYDAFVRDRLPPPAQQPEFLLLDYPERLNAAAELLKGGSPDDLAVINGHGSWIYADLDSFSGRIARLLIEEGLVPGNRVLLRGPNSYTMFAAWLGVLKAGGVVVATMPLLRPGEIATVIERAEIRILSLGAKPIFVEGVAGIEGEGQGGYASETSAEYQKAQADLVSAHIAKQDIVITTALIPGRPAPRLISDAQLATMRPGSVIVDLAAEAGGNVEGTSPGKNVVRHGVTVVGAVQLARTLAADSSALFARNLYNFLSAFWDKDAAKVVLPADDEIGKALRVAAKQDAAA